MNLKKFQAVIFLIYLLILAGVGLSETGIKSDIYIVGAFLSHMLAMIYIEIVRDK